LEVDAGDVHQLCQQALRAIELEAEKQDQHDRFIRQVMDVEKDICKFLGREWHPSGMSLVSLVADLQTELTAARNERGGSRWCKLAAPNARICYGRRKRLPGEKLLSGNEERYWGVQLWIINNGVATAADGGWCFLDAVEWWSYSLPPLPEDGSRALPSSRD
jgi:hypothetical protein